MAQTGEDMRLLERALIYATERHAGQTRKGKDKAYILHPMDVVLILDYMGADEELLAAGALHDTVEDTDATLEEIRDLFGPEVARLVAAHSEDMSRSWKERKEHTIETLKTGDKRVRMLVLADKVSNLRDLYRDHEAEGEAVWDRFNAPREEQSWYYSGVIDALEDLQFEPDCGPTYGELVALYKEVFVTYYFDSERETLYQMETEDEGFVLRRNRLEWQPFSGPVPQDARPLERVQAEGIESVWHDMSLWESGARTS